MAGLHVVFLQGTPSPFFSKIANALAEQGCKTTIIALCPGDWLFSCGQYTINYRGSFSNWPRFITDFFDRSNATDIIMLGDQRDYHKQAVAIAKARGIRVAIVDFGYLRPGWLTFERDGKSTHSHFPKNMEAIRALASAAPNIDLHSVFNDNFWDMAKGDLLYSLSNMLLWWLYPRFRPNDKRAHPLIYFPAMGWRLLHVKESHRRARQNIQSLIANKTPYFFFPLQLENDFQIIAYSPFKNLEEAICKVFESFSQCADKKTRLIVKIHPWDPCLKNWKKRIAQHATHYGISERVDYLDGGDLEEIIRHSLGMITVNSTAGIQALRLACPVKTLGDAVYDVPGLTSQQKLDDYWNNPERPDLIAVSNFLQALAATIQIRGGFFSEPGISAAAHEAAARLCNKTVGKIHPI